MWQRRRHLGTAREGEDWPEGLLLDPEDLRPRGLAHLLLLTIAAFFVTFLAWAARASLEEVTRGSGRVVPSRQVQVVQHLEGGILAEISTREGATVETGEVLMRIDNMRAASDYREKKARYLGVLAAIARLEAELAGTEPTFPAEVLAEAPEIAEAERRLFDTRAEDLANNLAVLASQSEQRRRELAETRQRVEQLARSLALAREELALTRNLAKDRLVARADWLKLERQVNELDSEYNQMRMAIPRLEAAAREAEERIESAKSKFRSEAQRELATLRSELAGLREIVLAGEDRVRRTEVRSPVRGTVKKLHVNTIGGVVQPGADLVEIVPLEDTLLVEANIRPSDIAFIRPGQPARVKITAYDYAIYGSLDGRVEHISADTITNERGESFFIIRVRTDRNYLGTAEHPLQIIPGMTAEVDILTGRKTVLDYLLKPVLKARYNALTER
ncbi:Type I secretion system membrane fusion protein PrsE [bacterium HR40]|nr:Type I secretion system membrane fusion protein PrsE [bacterium HR40]